MSGTHSAAQMAQTDADCLKCCCINFWNVPAQDYNDQDIPHALHHAGVVGFNADFIGLAEVDIDALVVPALPDGTTPERRLHIMDYRRIKALLAFFHDRSRKIPGGHISVSSATKANFEAHMTGAYCPDQPIIPHGVPLPNQDDEALNNWRKHVKPNEKAFKPFKDEHAWHRTKDHIQITLHAQNLNHLVDDKFTVMKKRLDAA